IRFTNASSVRAIGDVDGDGFDDLLVVGPAEVSGVARFRIVFGATDWQPQEIAYDQLTDERSREMRGFDPAVMGRWSPEPNAVAAGDVNSDGFDDFFISPQWTDGNDQSTFAMAALVLGRDFRGSV